MQTEQGQYQIEYSLQDIVNYFEKSCHLEEKKTERSGPK